MWTRPPQGVTGWLLGPGVMAHGLLLLGSGLVRREGCLVNNILGLSTVHRLLRP